MQSEQSSSSIVCAAAPFRLRAQLFIVRAAIIVSSFRIERLRFPPSPPPPVGIPETRFLDSATLWIPREGSRDFSGKQKSAVRFNGLCFPFFVKFFSAQFSMRSALWHRVVRELREPLARRLRQFFSRDAGSCEIVHGIIEQLHATWTLRFRIFFVQFYL